MYVEYDSVRDFFFLAPPAFLGLSPTLGGGLAILVFLMCWLEAARWSAHFRGVGEPLTFGDE